MKTSPFRAVFNRPSTAMEKYLLAIIIGYIVIVALKNPLFFSVETLFDMLRSAGLTLYEHPMPDHHAFKAGDLNFGDNLPVIMTEKDAVKCIAFADERCWYVPVTAEFSENEARELTDLVLARASEFKRLGAGR